MKSIKVNLIEQGMKLMNHKPTFIHDNYTSQLDNIFVNNSSKISKIIQISDSLSDHDIIGVQRLMNITQVEEQYVMVRNLKILTLNHYIIKYYLIQSIMKH